MGHKETQFLVFKGNIQGSAGKQGGREGEGGGVTAPTPFYSKLLDRRCERIAICQYINISGMSQAAAAAARCGYDRGGHFPSAGAARGAAGRAVQIPDTRLSKFPGSKLYNCHIIDP
jgi:hypothetical protein